MPDASNLYPNLNAIDFLKYMGGIKKVKYSTNDYWTVLEKVGLNNVKDKKLKDFSFGMKKKISIAQAILGDPSLIILDEPTSGLDPESSIKIRKLILNLKQQGKTIFLTSHNFEEIEEICDRLAIMNNGQIAKMGTIDELKNSTNEIKIQIKTLKKLASNQLYDINNILKDNSQTLEIQEDNLFCIEVSSINEIPKIISILTENNIEIIEVTQQRSSLQDIFMSI